MIQTIKPVGKRVLLMLDAVEEQKSKGGLFLAPTITELPKYMSATIISVGDEVTVFTIGERVLVNRLKSDELEVDYIKYNLIHCDDISFKLID